MHSTIITASFNVVGGSTTFKSATVAADGDGFIAQDIWFQNTARPQKHSSDLQPVKGSFKSYVGRPWKQYSRTVVMQSNNGAGKRVKWPGYHVISITSANEAMKFSG
ncbi:hypothetical protein POTOM_016668 [Populus tomentosa]|uniref:Pectinesterase catalytic domain-containing protein n=1 Tax=Populus tomentosa TaxID=118781 RepID=A0A8X7ZYY0_POPTO|nr:hypothetical protein POTOM_016668 [Populus tomentosa]